MNQMPESSGIGAAGGVIGGLSFLGGVALSLIGKGKRDQKIDTALTKLEALDGAVATIDRHDKKLDSLEEAMRTLAASFVVDGNPRYITVTACKGEQGHCRDVVTEKLLAGNARFGVVEANIKRIETDVREIKESQKDNLKEILDEIRKNK